MSLLVQNGNRVLPCHLGRYELLSEIAAGGMASVYLARVVGAAGFERTVAVKCCHPHLRTDPEFVAMFLDEARLAARIHHPNVVATLDVDDSDDLYLVMEFVEGDRLSALSHAVIRAGTRLSTPVVLRMMLDSLAGLDAAHALRDEGGQLLGLVHRDVSPQNILVGIDGVTRITDFGIARARARAAVTRDGMVKGKIAYMAPEQFSGSAATPAADVFAAGVVCWQLLAGRPLFQAETDAATVMAVLRRSIPPPSRVHGDLPHALDEILRQALARDVTARFASAAAFAEAIEQSGLAVASHRAVARAVEAHLGDQIALRRRLAADVRVASARAGRKIAPPGARTNASVAGAERGPDDSLVLELRTLRHDGWIRPSVPPDRPGAPPANARQRSRGVVALATLTACVFAFSFAAFNFVSLRPRTAPPVLAMHERTTVQRAPTRDDSGMPGATDAQDSASPPARPALRLRAAGVVPNEHGGGSPAVGGATADRAARSAHGHARHARHRHRGVRWPWSGVYEGR